MNDYFGYEGKKCVITGASSGMGKATAERLVDMGAEVYALDWAECDVKGIKAYIKVNLGEKDSIDKAFERLPEKIDRFFGIAGVSGMKTDYNTTVTINFIGNKYITDDYLADRIVDGGAIAYITSTAGLDWEKPALRNELIDMVEAKGWEGTVNVLESLNQSAMPGSVGYVYSKRCMNLFIAHRTKSFLGKKVRVNAVLPAATVSGLTSEFNEMSGGEDKLLAVSIGIDRYAESREMAEPILFLNSNMASFISGEMLCVDFGMLVQRQAGFLHDMSYYKLLGI